MHTKMSICAPNCCSWQTAAPAAEGKKGRHLRFLPSLNTRFPCNHSLDADGRLRKREKRERQRIFTTAWYNTFPHFGCRTATSNLGLRRRGMTVPRNCKSGVCGQHLRIRRSVQFILAGPVHHNALTNCAARICRACVE